MQQRYKAGVAVLAALGLMLVFASSALALPSYGMCSGCHTLSTSVTVHATETTNNGTTASYSVVVAGPNAGNGWAVYDGSTRLAYATGASGTFTVATGKTYTVFGGNANSNSQLYNTVTISPVASTPPSTGTSGTPGATSTPDPTSTPITTGTPNPTDTPTPGAAVKFRVYFNLHGHVYAGLKAKMTDSSGRKRYVVAVDRSGYATFHVPPGTYRLTTLGNSKFKSKPRTVHVRVPLDD